jgi:hypothetical protein
MGAGSLEARVSALEQIIIIIISSGGWRPGGPYGGDPFNTDTTRLEALYRHIPKGDPFASDVTRLSVTEVEEKALQVSAELTRLQGLQGELNARLKELRAKK